MRWIDKYSGRVLQASGLLGLFLLFSPLLGLGIGCFETPVEKIQWMLTIDQWQLLGKTMGISLGAALLCVVLALFAGYSIGFTPFGHKIKKQITVTMLLLLLVPYPVHGLVWSRIFYNTGLGQWLIFAPVLETLWVQAMVGLPLAVLILINGIQNSDGECIQSCMLFTPPGFKRLRLILPLMLPALLTGGLVVFVLSVGDYGIASLFGVTTYAMAIQTQLTLGGSIAQSVVFSMPLMGVALLAWALAWQIGMRHLNVDGKPIYWQPTEDRSAVGWISTGGLAVVLMAPGAILAGVLLNPGAWSNVIGEAQRSFVSLITAFGLAGIIALAGGVMGAGITCFMALGPRNRWRQMLLTIPFALPAPVAAIGLLQLFTGVGVPYVGPVGFVMALVARYLPVMLIVIIIYRNSLEQSMMDAASIYGVTPYHTRRWIVIGLLKKAVAIGAFLMGVMVSADTGVFILLAPPGTETVGVRLYNYLHYGANDMALAMSLVYGLGLIGVVWSGKRVYRKLVEGGGNGD